MVKTATAPAKSGKATPATSKGNEVATRGSGTEVGQVSEELVNMMREDTGKGVSTRMEDNIVPLVYVLQAQSPQAQKKKEEYVDGAEAGSIWFRGTKVVVSGDDGFPAVPVCFSVVWIEWMPNRGGFVARHPDRPAEATLKTDPENPKRKFWALPNGNVVVETREQVIIALDVFDVPTPFVIPMSGSNHAASRDWMTKQNSKSVPGFPDEKAPAFGYIYRLKTKFRTNDQGDWYMWDVDDENGVKTPQNDVGVYRLARQIEKDFNSGKLKAAQIDPEGLDDRGGGGEELSKHI
jgi:hypothetical protein